MLKTCQMMMTCMMSTHLTMWVAVVVAACRVKAEPQQRTLLELLVECLPTEINVDRVMGMKNDSTCCLLPAVCGLFAITLAA